ncbi:RNA 3'-terminal phosphate cyclase, partial [Clarias magur]
MFYNCGQIHRTWKLTSCDVTPYKHDSQTNHRLGKVSESVLTKMLNVVRKMPCYALCHVASGEESFRPQS